jgi:predicted transcriptional regulator
VANYKDVICNLPNLAQLQRLGCSVSTNAQEAEDCHAAVAARNDKNTGVIASYEAISQFSRLNKIAASLSLLAMTKILVSLRGTKQSHNSRA